MDVLVAGYASIDIVYQAASAPHVGATTLLRGPVVSRPRCGGCGPATAATLARAGCAVGLITWLGDDAEGRACLRRWEIAGIDTSGVVVAAGQASPRCYLFYDPDGGVTCYYHPSGSAALAVAEVGQERLRDAAALAITVGPAALTRTLLAARRARQPLFWNVKADADAFPPDVRAWLAREAAVVCLNRGELPFAASALPPAIMDPRPSATGATGKDAAARSAARGNEDPHEAPPLLTAAEAELAVALQRHSGGIVVVTAGSAGCRVHWPGGAADVPAVPVDVSDPTGAGDAFFGAFVAEWLRGAGPEVAARAAARRVADELRERLEARG